MGIGDIFGGGGMKAARAASRVYDNIDVPSIDDQMLILQQYVDSGEITPEEAKAYLVQNNAVDNMQLDTEGKDAQLAALDSLSEIGNEGGLTASDKAKLAEIANDENTQARGAREAIIQNAESRGAGGSGLEMLAQLENSQNAATRKSARDLGVAGMAQERALQALQAAGQLGGTINTNQFNQQKAIADSNNEIAKFNANNQQQVGLVNTAANNAAQAANVESHQKISNANTDLSNQQQQFNKGLAQTNFNNRLNVAQGKANALNGVANQANKDTENAQKLAGTAITAAAAFSDERVKEDVEKFDAGKFLDDLTGYRYKYKDPSMGHGEQVGVMAQDLEKEAPQMVEDTPEGKMVDYSPAKAGGPIFASLADLHGRLKRLEGK
jgi:hypothetical protein